MELIKTKKGKEIAINRIDYQRLHILFDSSIKYRIANDNSSNINVVNVGNEKTFMVGGKVFYEKMFWSINKIQKLNSDNLNEFVLFVTPIYNNNGV